MSFFIRLLAAPPLQCHIFRTLQIISQLQWIKPRNSFLCFLIAASLCVQILRQEVASASTIPDDPPNAQSCDHHAEGEWIWVDRSGQTKSEADLQKILNDHQRWLGTAHREGERADLSGAKLKKAVLPNRNLSEALLTDSDLSYVDLTGALLSKTALRGANLTCASLKGAQLEEVDLTGIDLTHTIISNAVFNYAILVGVSLKGSVLGNTRFNSTNLSGADLSGADLANAEIAGSDLRNANLKNANLIGVNLSQVRLEDADLFGATYEPSGDPTPKSIAFAKNIEYMTYRSNSGPLASLRGVFKEMGFRDQERKITFSLKSRQGELLRETCADHKGNCVEYWVNRILFDHTSQYGMNPGRVLVILLVIVVLSTLIYWLLMIRLQNSGLSIIIPEHQDNQPLWLLADLSNPGVTQTVGLVTTRACKVQPRELHQFKALGYYREWIRRERALVWVSFVFSLMSTFNIKFRDVDFGRWLRQLTTKEYDIKAVGWTRTVSGLQALLSVYFIALLLVTYFGRPFD